jgi:peptidoglycan hydrolase CwlO-like protein
MIQAAKDSLTNFANEVQRLDDVADELKNKIKQNKSACIEHFKAILKERKDTRSEGLQWVVKELWRLEAQLTTENFPDFLDDDAVHCILFLA